MDNRNIDKFLNYEARNSDIRSSEPLVSIIVPVFNKSCELHVAIQSIQQQTLADIEIICVDDGSTDSSLAELVKLESADSRIKVLHQANAGAGAARNLGLHYARGRFVGFVDPDDRLVSNNALENLYSAADHASCAIVGGNILTYNKKGIKVERLDGAEKRFEGTTTIEFRDYQSAWFFQRFLFLRDFLLSNHIEFPNYRRVQDPPFLCEALGLAGEFVGIDCDYYGYTIRRNQIAWNSGKLFDAYSGIKDVLLYSAANDLPHLHWRTTRDLMSDELFVHSLLQENTGSILAYVGKIALEVDSSMIGELQGDYLSFLKNIHWCIEMCQHDGDKLEKYAKRQLALLCFKSNFKELLWEHVPLVFIIMRRFQRQRAH